MPGSAPLSGSVTLPAGGVFRLTTLPDTRLPTLIPTGAGASSPTDPITGDLLASSTGASFTALMVMLAVSVAAENAVAPPLVVVSTLLPAPPLVWSQARKVMALLTMPLKFAFGWKYRRVAASAPSSSAELSATAPTAVQFEPLSRL